MIEMDSEVRIATGRDLYEFVVRVDALQICVANTASRQQEMAQRVGELAMAVALDFMQKQRETEVESDGA